MRYLLAPVIAACLLLGIWITGADLRRYATVVIWCRAFSVLFARAPLA